MAATKDTIVLSNTEGTSQPMVLNVAHPNIPASSGYTQGKMDGSDSYFVVYSIKDYNDTKGAQSTRTAIVDSQRTTNFGFTAQSTQGFNRDGITLFEHYFFCGKGKTYDNSNSNITGDFPSGVPGVSSVIITEGWWSLYKSKNYSNIVEFNKEKRFGPGTRITGLQGANDKVQSIRRFETSTED